MAVSTGAAILGGSALSALSGARSSRKSSDAMSDSNNASIAEQRRQYDLSRADQQPFREAGVNSLNQLQSLLNDPNYMQNLTNQGIGAIDRSAASRGHGLGSGGHLKDLTEFTAGKYTGDYLNRLSSMAGVGQTATNNLNSLGQNFANNMTGLNTANGNARASGYMGQANSLNNLVSQGMTAYGAGMFGSGGGSSNLGGSISYAPQNYSLGG